MADRESDTANWILGGSGHASVVALGAIARWVLLVPSLTTCDRSLMPRRRSQGWMHCSRQVKSSLWSCPDTFPSSIHE